ncbi:MAG: hypothetical protein SCH71_11940 [Desulfobulbaceae bacterium]|nr:hypothetical protein [Desulfobulbaceae bacterium]
MQQKKIPPDTFQIRCPKLGHQIHFAYCREENFGLPCVKTLNCWFSYFRVEEYLRSELTPDEFSRLFQEPPKSKVQSLMEMIDQAQKRSRKKDG